MSRRPLPPGVHGNITVREIAPGVFKARCWYRALNGEMLRPAARGKSETDAIYSLQEALAELAKKAVKGELTADDRFRKGAEMWLDERREDVANGVLSANSLEVYESVLKNHVLPRVGSLRFRECKVAVFNSLIRSKRTDLGYSSAATIRTVCSGICGLAVQHEALDANPIRSISRLVQAAQDRKEIVAMKAKQIHQMWDALADYATKKEKDEIGRRLGRRSLVWKDLPDLSRGMLALGTRIGELLAITGSDVELDTEGRYLEPDEVAPAEPYVYVTVDWHLVREKGKGIIRKRGRKGPDGGKEGSILRVPMWSKPMWLRRKLAAGEGPIFASLEGGWLDPSNTTKRLRAALDGSGFAWVTSHVWRKTVDGFMEESGMTPTERADHLGNTPAVEEKHYRPKRKINRKAAAALEVIERSG